MDFPSIALLTDFGDRDGFVGVMKGVILSQLIQPVPLIDLSHQIAPQNIRQALWVLESAYAYFPPKTIFMAVVDPDVGSAKQASLLAYWPERQQFFIAPDNGLLTPIYEAAGSSLQIYDIRQSSIYQQDTLSLHGRSQTFHGRDVYAPMAARAANAILQEEIVQFLAQFSPPLNLEEAHPIRFSVHKPSRIEEGTKLKISGEIQASDHFGNLITNIPNEWASPGDLFEVSLNQQTPIRCLYQESYSAPSIQQAGTSPFILVPSSGGTLELAIFMGSAQAALQTALGDAITLIGPV